MKWGQYKQDLQKEIVQVFGSDSGCKEKLILFVNERKSPTRLPDVVRELIKHGALETSRHIDAKLINRVRGIEALYSRYRGLFICRHFMMMAYHDAICH
jgi:hypothetical protein